MNPSSVAQKPTTHKRCKIDQGSASESNECTKCCQLYVGQVEDKLNIGSNWNISGIRSNH